MAPIELAATEYLKISTPDTDAARQNVQALWKKFYAPMVSEYCQNRKKFVTMGALCNSVQITKIANIKKQAKQNNECDNVYIEFTVHVSIKYRKQCVNIRLCSIFNDSLDLYDDNEYNEHWQQALFYELSQDKSTCIIDNGELNKDHCSMVAELFGFDENNADIMDAYLKLLWKWFIGKELMRFRVENLNERMWQHSPTSIE